MGDVLEYLVDGTSGLAPGGVDGKAMVAGVCSRGQVGKAYLLGPSSDLDGLLGTGPLVDRLRDVLATAGQEPTIVAVPVQGQQGGYISDPVWSGGNGSYPAASVSGVPQKNADVVVEVVSAGQVGTATVKVSTDGGTTFGSAETAAAQVVIGKSNEATGATLLLPEEASLEEGWSLRFLVRCAAGPVERIGDESSPLITVTGDVLAGAELSIQIVKGGDRNVGTYQLSVDGGDTYEKVRTIPVDGTVATDLGVTITFPAGEYVGGTTYTCRLLPPEPSIVDVLAALESPLSLYDIEFVYIVGPSDSVDWSALSVKADELWNLHRPTYFKCETRLPRDDEDLNDFAAYLLAEKQDFASRFVQVCCQYGEVADSTGLSKLRNWGGLQAGRVISIPVQRATGRVRDGNISQGTLPEGWEAVQPTLEEAGYLTAKKYAGLSGAYWGDSRTMADDTSDYRYEEVLRVVFKAVRKMRIAALKSMYDDLDPVVPDSDTGIGYLKANISGALDTMVAAVPKELADYDITIPSGQDYVNKGVAVEVLLIGIGIIREIKLYASYAYAGTRGDTRLEG